MLKINDRVKLTPRAAESFSRRRGGRSGKFDWSGRRGTVVRITKLGRSVFVMWDGRSSVDEWPVEAIEVACDDPNG